MNTFLDRETTLKALRRAAEVAKHAHQTGLTLKQSALELGYLSEAEYDALVDPARMV